MNVRQLMQLAPVIPVLVIEDLDHARPMAEALIAGGLRVLEVTLRTPVALEAMAIMAEVPGAVAGVGTVLDGDDLKRAQDKGASFAVSPGYTPELGKVANQIDLPLLPGIATSADIMRARDGGFTELKFFPAAAAGGGITENNARDYLAQPNVLCVGGSWVAPKAMAAAGDWEGIRMLASAAMSLKNGSA